MKSGNSRPSFLLAEPAIKTCSPGTRVRLGALGVGRVRMLRSVKDSPAIPLTRIIQDASSRIARKRFS